MSDERVDPRFDPRYQRGYVPAETGDRVDAPRRLLARPDRSVTPVQPIVSPPASPRIERAIVAPASALVVDPDVHNVSDVEPAPAETPTEWRRPGVNPFMAALLILAIVLIASAGWFTWWAATTRDTYTFSTQSSPFGVILNEVRYYAGGMLWSAGGLALVGWLTLSAVRSFGAARSLRR